VLVRLYAAIAHSHIVDGNAEAAREALHDGAAVEERWGRCMSCTRYLAAASEALSQGG
jgi:hypothetical protein